MPGQCFVLCVTKDVLLPCYARGKQICQGQVLME